MRQRTWNRSLLAPALAAMIGLSTPVAAENDDDDEDLYQQPGFYLTGIQLHDGLVYVSEENTGLWIFRPEF